jgi:dTDP-glucose pyrophosphorylase
MKSVKDNHEWVESLLSVGSTIKKAVTSLEGSGMQIVLVTSDSGVLLGLITDGDVRRAFLAGLNLDDLVERIMNPRPLVVSQNVSAAEVLQLMTDSKVHQIPIVDSDSRVVGLHILDNMLKSSPRPNTLLIMAGGRGTRLQPYTQDCPKPMLLIGEKPMLEHILDRAILDGFRNFIISLNYLPKVIEDHFEDGSRWGVNITYVREDSPLGTAGALSLVEEKLIHPLVVINGDIISDLNLSDVIAFHERNEAAATMVGRPHEVQNPFGVIVTDGVNLDSFDEKPVYTSLVNAGIYIMNPEMLKYLEPNEHCDMPTFFLRIKEKNRVIVYPMYERWLDVGRPEDLMLARKFDGNLTES